ncbi:MAG: hypothetical protein WCX64_05370 [Candidatus Micrarchaeia archaeon]
MEPPLSLDAIQSKAIYLCIISTDIVNNVVDFAFKTKNILRYPRLDTLLMVEKAIHDAGEYPTKAQLLRNLDKKIMYQTFNLILDYLEYSGKIHVGKDGRIVWIWDPEGVAKVLSNKRLVVR